MKRTFIVFALFCCTLIASCGLIPGAQTQGATTQIDALVFKGTDFSSDNSTENGLIISDDGLSLDDESFKADYESPIIEAPIAFNAIVPEWRTNMPDAEQVTVSLRTSADGINWEAWTTADAHADWMVEDDDWMVGDMLVVGSAETTHSYLQYRIALTRNAVLDNPLLEELRLTLIDSTAGPTTAELIEIQQELDEEAGITQGITAENAAKPTVISRAAWCNQPECNYSNGLEYQTVSHLILHHTVTSGGPDTDFAAIVRAIWSYHTFTRGWGDIGYNYLVDLNGVIYEGHNGGDDVIGTHASGANAGSMAVSIIGNFNEVTPPEPMMNSVIDMFTWKADQRDINVYEASNTLPNISWGLPTLMGHRDVYGTTECPGHKAHALLPYIRDRVAANLGLVDPHIYVDELSDGFTRSGGEWNEAQLGCGYNTHAYYTFSTTNSAESVEWAEWRPTIPADGRYRIEVYAPYCNTGSSETSGARYTVNHADGQSTVSVDQDENIGLWTSLGEFNLKAGTSTAVRLTDLTDTDSGRGVWFDAIRFMPLETAPPPPEPSNLNPANNAWLSTRQVTFNWQVDTTDDVAGITLQVSNSAEFSNNLHAKLLPATATSTTHTFTEDAKQLYWRVVLTLNNGDVVPSAPTTFSLDATPPTSSVDTLYWLPQANAYAVEWSGTDATAGIAGYTISTRNGDGEWQTWRTNTPDTEGLYVVNGPHQTLGFRSRAVDQIGNLEPAKTTPDLTSDDAISLSHAILLPVLLR